LTAFWAWRSGAMAEFRLGAWRAPLAAVAAILFVMLILSKSVGALGLGMVGAATLLFCSWTRTRFAVLILLLIPALYVYSRAWVGWTGMGVTDAVGTFIDRDRAESFEFRLDNENLLIGKAMKRPLFGWGGWGRSRVYNADGVDVTTADGLWIIVFGNQGAFGLLAVGLTIGLPAVLVFFGIPIRSWGTVHFAFPVVLAMTLVLYLIDDLANAMVNPVFMLIAGGLNSLAVKPGWPALSEGASRTSRATAENRLQSAARLRPTNVVRARAKFGPVPTASANPSALVDPGVD
jgi:hypothetical protein